VDEAFRLGAFLNPDGSLKLQWQIHPGYYLYRHTLELQAPGQQLTMQLPPGRELEDPYFGLVEIYTGQLELLVPAVMVIGRNPLELVYQGCAEAGLCYPPRRAVLAVGSTPGVVPLTLGDALAASAITPVSGQGQWLGLLWALPFALLGGLLLNFMPCVFPVLVLKSLGLVTAPPARRRWHGLCYSAGVLCFFWLLALVLLLFRAAGSQVGWGFQLQSPLLVTALIYLFLTMGLSLSGWFVFAGRLASLGGLLATHSGAAGAFASGALVVVAASPCTAPFMAAALGFALVQPPLIALAVFTALGLGLALPMGVVSWWPRLARSLPKPGPWLEELRQWLAFPLYAAALWLLWVLGRQTGADGMAVVLSGALLLVFGLWLLRQGGQGVGVRRGLVAVALAVSCLLPVTMLPDFQAGAARENRWRAYDEGVLQGLRQQRQPVFIKVGADWCLTCLANERLVLESAAVRRLFADYRMQGLVADWTRPDPRVSALLRRHGRSGVPLYLLFPPDQEAIILPQLLTRGVIQRHLAEHLGPAPR